MNIGNILKYSGIVVLALAAIGITSRLMYSCGVQSREQLIEELSHKLVQSEKTVEIKDGLYTTQLVESKRLTSLVNDGDIQNKKLLQQLQESKTELLSTQQLVVRWKGAYEGAISSKQTDSGPSPSIPGVTRKRVDFEGGLGPISVTGHTLTDPPESFVSLRQLRPLSMTVSVARDRNGKWSSLVTSSEPGMSIDVRMGAVDPGIISAPSWYQRIWADFGAAAIGDYGASFGLSYRGDRFSVGVSCFQFVNDRGCGGTIGARIFK